MSLPQVVHEDHTLIVSEMQDQYAALTGKTLEPAQIDAFLVDVIGYRELVLRAAINDGARQGLVDFARLPMLIELGKRVSTYLMPAQSAKTTFRFSRTVPVSTATPIPKGFRVESESGAVFATAYEALIPAGQTFVDVLALSDTAGLAYNGLIQGSFKNGFDQLPDGVEVTNLTMTNGGADDEDIERFRRRVKLAMARPSAGSGKAYLYQALSADLRVVDASVYVIAPGAVRVAVLVDGDADEVVAAVYRAISRDDVRPITDSVDVIAATPVAVPFDALLTPRRGAVIETMLSTAQSALNALALKLRRTLGYDTVESQVSAALQTPLVKRVLLTNADMPIAPHQYAVLTWELDTTEPEDD